MPYCGDGFFFEYLGVRIFGILTAKKQTESLKKFPSLLQK